MYPDWDTIQQIIQQLLPSVDVLLRLLKEKSEYITKHLMSGPSGNYSSPDVSRDEVRTLGKTKLTVSLGTIH